MKIGLGSYAYRWSIGIHDHRPPEPLTPLDLLHKASELGVGVVQYADNMPLHRVSAADLQELALESKRIDIDIELGAQGLNGDLLATYVDLAETLGSRLIRLSLDAEDATKPLDRIERELSSVLARCQAQGVSLAIENHFHFPSPKLVAILQQIDHPSLGICLDVANSIAVQEWPQETIELLAPFAQNLHLKDYRIQLDPYGVGFRVTGTPLGQGQLDIGMVFDALEASGRDVNVILEHWMPQGATGVETRRMEDDWIAQSVHAARDFLGRRGSA